MFGTFWALVPPIIAIALALITKEVYSSLFIGAVAGALFYAGFHVEALDSLLNDGVVPRRTSRPAAAPCFPPSCWASSSL